jgi:hypothetical protein
LIFIRSLDRSSIGIGTERKPALPENVEVPAIAAKPDDVKPVFVKH